MSTPPSWQHHRARIAALSRDRRPDDPEIAAARIELKAARLAEHVQRVVDAAPPLTEHQLDRIGALLRRGGASDAA